MLSKTARALSIEGKFKMDKDTFTSTIRISCETERKIKKYAEKVGSNFNSTVCVLLDLGLKVVSENITILKE
jgi:hypothetical protein